MKTKNAIAYLIITFLAGILLSTAFYYIIYVDTIQIYEIQLETASKNAFNIATDKIYFAKVKPGSSSEKQIQITGHPDKPVIANFKIKGPLKEWIIIKENGFLLQPNEIKNLSLTAYVPYDAEIGIEYESKLIGTFTNW